MKNQVLFSSKDKTKKLKHCLLQFFFGALRVNKQVDFQRNQLYDFCLPSRRDQLLTPVL